MVIKLMTADVELHRLCVDIAAQIREVDATFSIASDGDTTDADLYIWDVEGSSIAAQHRIDDNPAKHLFLVERSEIAEFCRVTPAAKANILLKPVTAAMLTVRLTVALTARTANSFREDRDEMLQYLIQTNLKLQEYDQDRTNFLARAVHDFRTPLTALSGYCGLLLTEPLGHINQNQRDVLQRMQNSASRLSRMASGMFQLSLGRRIPQVPDLRPGEIRLPVEQALHEVAPFVEEKRIAVSLNVSDSEGEIYFEPGQIEQVVINILDNACKFTPKAGRIEIQGYPFFWERRNSNVALESPEDRRRRMSRNPNSYRIDIQDSGPPILREHLDCIFEEYTSYAGGRDRSGGGLGLAICKMLIAQHNGKIWADNTEQGPMFSFVLPTRGTNHANN